MNGPQVAILLVVLFLSLVSLVKRRIPGRCKRVALLAIGVAGGLTTLCALLLSFLLRWV